MLSSISNSDKLKVQKKWGLSWALALMIVFFVTLFFELFWRGQGHTPSVTDDVSLWSYHRNKLDCNSPKTVILIGKSRIQLGFSLQMFKKLYPSYKIIQLAIANGTSPVAVLNDIAANTTFKGILICSMESKDFLKSRWSLQQNYVDYYYRNFSVNSELNRHITTFLQKNLVIMHSYLGFKESIKHMTINGGLPKPSHISMDENRRYYGDFSRRIAYLNNQNIMHLERKKKKKIKKITKDSFVKKADEFKIRRSLVPRSTYTSRSQLGIKQSKKAKLWLEHAMAIVYMGEKIISRGGKVVFVHYPITGKRWKNREKTFPKDRYWDRLSAISNIEMIHFKNILEFQRFSCPDNSHLDYRDVPLFTQLLLNQLIHRGIIENYKPQMSLL
jgi:hypothetical protein